jgi:hypothetical protein
VDTAGVVAALVVAGVVRIQMEVEAQEVAEKLHQ